MTLKEEIKYALKFDDDDFDMDLYNRLQESLVLTNSNNITKETIRKSVYDYNVERLATDKEFEEGDDCIYIKKLPESMSAKAIAFEGGLTPNNLVYRSIIKIIG